MATHHVYINKTNEERFSQEDNKSGLVNELLEEHYAEEVSQDSMTEQSSRTEPQPKGKKEVDLSDIPGMTPACCLNKKKRCKHWQYNDIEQTWQNTITGETQEAFA